MKNISLLTIGAFAALSTSASFAKTISPLQANSITAGNIAVMQHSVMLNAFDNFGASMTRVIAERPVAESNVIIPKDEPISQELPTDQYGKMLFYGEYGDDGTVFSKTRGRSGGDSSEIPALWLNWQHAQDYAKFDKFKRVDSNYDLMSLGISDDYAYADGDYSSFGGFGGLAIAHEDSQSIKLSEAGEYVGLYYAYHVNNGFVLQTAADGGALFTDAKSDYGKHDFTNLWLGVAANALYNVYLDDVSVLQPSLYIGYTWIHANGYKPQPNVTTNDFGIFELSPAIKAITHIADGWYASMSVRYVANFTNGGETHDAGVVMPNVELMNYYEYGLSVEKSLSHFNFVASINRRDAGRTGWNGNIRMIYAF